MNAPQASQVAQYQARRSALMAQMRALSGGGVAIVRTAPEVPRNADSDYPYRYDSSFYYLTGFDEPDAVLVLDANTQQSTLFCRNKDQEREIWDGYRWGPSGARDAFGMDAAGAIDDFAAQLPGLLANQAAAYIQFGNAIVERDVGATVTNLRALQRLGKMPPQQLRDVNVLLSEMRLIKDTSELATMAQAAKISALAHVRAMQSCRVGQREYTLEAELLHGFRSAGSQFPAYGSIVAAGANSCVLHYRAGDAVLKSGDMVLIDAGCELNGYASDITRTFPVNGRFTAEQKAVYELVLAAQNASLAQLAPGKTFNQYNDAATRVLAQGMIDLGWIHGSLDGVLESGSYRQFYMHRCGHWLGMDVHDCGDYRVPGTLGDDRPWRPLAAGMTLTVEPGCYIRPCDNVPEAFWNIGIRIEDDAVITETGYELTTRDVPVAINDIEALMRA